MANPLDINIPIAIKGIATTHFENEWFLVTQLVSDEPLLDMNLPIANNGRTSPYFESLWNGVAAKLNKDNIDINLFIDRNGRATTEFESAWDDLIT